MAVPRDTANSSKFYSQHVREMIGLPPLTWFSNASCTVNGSRVRREILKSPVANVCYIIKHYIFSNMPAVYLTTICIKSFK